MTKEITGNDQLKNLYEIHKERDTEDSTAPKKYLGKKWTVQTGKQTSRLHSEEILTFLEKQNSEEYKDHVMVIAKRIKKKTAAQEKKWSGARKWFKRLWNCLQGRGRMTTSERAERLLQRLSKEQPSITTPTQPLRKEPPDTSPPHLQTPQPVQKHKKAVSDSLPPPHPKSTSVDSLEKSLKIFCREHKVPKEIQTQLQTVHQTVLDERDDPTRVAKLTANIFGCETFSGRKLKGERDIEAPGSEHAIYRFQEGLATYADKLRAQGKTVQADKLQEMQEGYKTLYFSSLLRRAIKTKHKTKQSTEALEKVGRDILQKEITAVSKGEKSRGYWLTGSSDHFVPMRFERHSETGHLIIGCFNLGGGSEIFQAGKGDQRKVELRIGELTQTKEGKKILVSVEKFQEHFPEFCKQVVSLSAKGSFWNWALSLSKFLPKSPSKEQRAFVDSVPMATVQKMGDCTCKGQWALLKKEFLRLGLDEAEFRQFFLEQNLTRMQEKTGAEEASLPKTLPKVLSFSQIYRICKNALPTSSAQPARDMKAAPSADYSLGEVQGKLAAISKEKFGFIKQQEMTIQSTSGPISVKVRKASSGKYRLLTGSKDPMGSTHQFTLQELSKTLQLAKECKAEGSDYRLSGLTQKDEGIYIFKHETKNTYHIMNDKGELVQKSRAFKALEKLFKNE